MTKKIITIILTLFILFSFVGCGGSNIPPVIPEKPDDEIKLDYPITPDTEAKSIKMLYYNDAEIKNCAKGVLLVSKTSQFDSAIKSLEIKWGDGDDAFKSYNPLIKFSDMRVSEFEYTFTNNALIPLEATKIWTEALNSSGKVVEKGCASVEKYKKKNVLKYEFQAISDQQISSSPSYYRHSKTAFADIKETSPNSALIAVNGDVVDEAKASFYDSFYKSYSDVFTESNPTKMVLGLGNHEFIIQSENANYDGVSSAELNRRYDERLKLWKDKTKNTSPYFYKEINGSYFIFLGTTAMPRTLDGNTRADCTLGSEQLNWLKDLLVKASTNKKPIFLFSHGSLRDTVSGSLSSLNQTWYGYTLKEENLLRDIIKDYPQIMFFSSHSHWSFESDVPYVVNKNYPSFFNTAAVGYLWTGSGGGNKYDEDNCGAQGLYLEVYEDQLLIKGRQFEAKDGKSKYWYSGYQVVLPI